MNSSMLEAYQAHGMVDIAVFELFFRKLPPERGFLLVAGLEQAAGVSRNPALYAGGSRLAVRLRLVRAGLRGVAGGFQFHRRRACHAGRHGVLRQRADAARDRAAAAGAARRNAADQHPAFPDADRLQGGAHGAGSAGQSSWSISACAARMAPRPGCWRRGQATSRASPAPPHVLGRREFGIPLVGTMAHSFVQAHDDEATPSSASPARGRKR